MPAALSKTQDLSLDISQRCHACPKLDRAFQFGAGILNEVWYTRESEWGHFRLLHAKLVEELEEYLSMLCVATVVRQLSKMLLELRISNVFFFIGEFLFK